MSESEQVDFDKELVSVQERNNFMGIPIVANFAETYPPYCYADENGTLKGVFYDMFNVAAGMVNLTVIYQKPKDYNYNIWLNR